MDYDQPSAVTLFSQRSTECQITVAGDASFVTMDLLSIHRVSVFVPLFAPRELSLQPDTHAPIEGIEL